MDSNFNNVENMIDSIPGGKQIYPDLINVSDLLIKLSPEGNSGVLAIYGKLVVSIIDLKTHFGGWLKL